MSGITFTSKEKPMSVLPEVLAANAEYVENFGSKGSLALPPARRFAILTCMDARLDPANTRDFLKATHTSSVTLGDAQVTTPFAL